MTAPRPLSPVGAAPSLSTSPWTRQMYAVCAVLAGLGAALFFVGTGIVSSEQVYDDQVPGMNVAILGVVLANAAGVLLLMAGRRSVTARRLRVIGAVPAPRGPAAVAPVAVLPSGLIGGEGLTHFHRAECAMAAGRDWPSVDRVSHENAGRRPCGVCKP